MLTWVRDEAWTEHSKGIESCSVEDHRLLSCAAAGKTNQEIAQELKIPLGIVAARLQRIYKRLRITRRSEAAGYFVRLEKGSLERTRVPH